MSNVIQFRRPLVSADITEKLIRLGYLHSSKRRNDDAIRLALDRLNGDLLREEIICEDDDPLKPA
jgi:hypothetical protein